MFAKANKINILFALANISPTEGKATPYYSPKQVSYIVLPHPDDEWQAWSMIENSPDNYKVFISLTKGEETRYCEQQYSTACEQKRISSWVGFMRQMSQSDRTLPGDLQYLGRRGNLSSRGYSLRRIDSGYTYSASRAAEVYIDRQNRGALVVFNLGDGDLTVDEVKWAVESVRDNRYTLGINHTLPNYNLIGSYYNADYEGCYIYRHPDHAAVHKALFYNDYGFAYNAAATCITDPDASTTKTVTSNSISSSWNNFGAFKTNYGWLGTYNLSFHQSELFMVKQSFWYRR